MSPYVLLALIAGLPLVFATLLRVKPLFLFVSIVTGYFWMTFLGDSAEFVFRSMVHVSNPDVLVRVGLLLLPVVLTLVLMRKTLPASALPFQFILLLANSLLLATFLTPLLTAGVQGTIYQTQIGDIFRQSHDVLIAGIAGVLCLVMWFMRPRHKGKHK